MVFSNISQLTYVCAFIVCNWMYVSVVSVLLLTIMSCSSLTQYRSEKLQPDSHVGYSGNLAGYLNSG